MKRLIAIIIILFLGFTINSKAQKSNSYFQTTTPDYSSSIQAIYTNIDIVNNSISKLKSRIRSLNYNLNHYKKSQKQLDDKFNSNIKLNSDDIKKLYKEFYNINVDYKTVLKQIKEFSISLDTLQKQLVYQELITNKINDNLMNLTKDYFLLKDNFNKIPKIYFCPDCYPKFSFSFSANKYFTFNVNDVTATPAYSLEFIYNQNKNISWWINYMSPFFVTITSKIQDNLQISDKWNTELISAGSIYKSRPFLKNTSFIIGGGIFWGTSKWDKYLNSTIGFTRGPIKNVYTYGANFRAELTYNEFQNKNPLEVFIGINSLISYNKIILDPGLDKSHDLGRFLLYFSIGMRFNFWNE